MRDIEHRLQTACVGWFRLQYPNRLIYAVPNGGARNPITGAKLKAEGVLAGVPDLCIAEPSGTYHGLYVEMKTSTGTVRPIQKEVIAKLKANGYAVAVVRSVDIFIDIVRRYLKNEYICQE